MAVIAWSNEIRKDMAAVGHRLLVSEPHNNDHALGASLARIVCALTMRTEGMPSLSSLPSFIPITFSSWEQVHELYSTLARLNGLLGLDEDNGAVHRAEERHVKDGVMAVRMLFALEDRFEAIASTCGDLMLAVS